MKKHLSIIFLLFFLSSADSNAQGNIAIGLRFNPEFSGIMNKNDADAGNELNYKSHYTLRSFGVGGVYSFNKNVGVAVDILFSREGQAFSGNFVGVSPNAANYSSVVSTQAFLNGTVIAGDYVALAELNYFKIPLMLSLTSDNTKPIFFTMLVGPQLNFLESVAQEVNHEDMDYPNTNIEPKDLYNSVVVSGVLAAGAGFNLSSHLILSAHIRFDYGFTDAEKKDVMVSYFNSSPVRFYSADRKSANSGTVGLLIALDYKL